jgi:[ribosomal protein S5]-alanine N-acetyltransferase
MNQVQIHPLATLTTERLQLRPLKPDDTTDIFTIRSNKDLILYTNRPLCTSLEDAALFITRINNGIIENHSAYWGVAFHHSKEIIGTICLWHFENENYRAEIGYEILPQYQQKGFMQEAVNAVVQYGFTILNLHSITAWLSPENKASIRLLEKTGFQKEGHLRENVCVPLLVSDQQGTVGDQQETVGDQQGTVGDQQGTVGSKQGAIRFSDTLVYSIIA